MNNLGNLDDLRGGDLNGPNYSSQESSGAPEQQNDDAAPLQGEASLPQQTGPAAQDITTDLGEAAAAASSVLVSAGGIAINLLFDAAAMAAPQAFRTAIEQAATQLSQAILDKITVNLNIDYSGVGRVASAGPDRGLYESYTTVRSDLVNHATPGDPTFNALPNATSIQGQSQVAVWNSELKLLGLLGANDATTDDGHATFSTDLPSNVLVGIALHELTHALGRIPFGPVRTTASTRLRTFLICFDLRAKEHACSMATFLARRRIFLSTAALRNWLITGRIPIRAIFSIAACKVQTTRSTRLLSIPPTKT